MQDVNVAVAQIEVEVLEPHRNRAVMENAINEAALQKCDLVVLPELSNTGFVRSYEATFARDLWRAAEPSDGEILKSLGEMAVRLQISIVVGLALRHPEIPGVLRNASVCFAKDGRRHQYTKVHLPRDEKRYFEEGSSFDVSDIVSCQLGMLVCADIAFPEAARCLALKGAEMIAVPTCAYRPVNPRLYEGLTTACAYANQAYVLMANRVGTDHGTTFGGGSLIAAPDGNVLALLGDGPGIATATLSGGLLLDERLRQTRFRDRRPYLYPAIVERSSQCG